MGYALYIATVIGAIALYLMMPRAGYTPRKIGALLGAATLGGLWLYLGRSLPDDLGMPWPAFAYYYIFSGLAIAAGVRVITHPKPVYAALWFVMVVLASSGLLLSLSAEFVAFAMVIIYGGAILVTYIFVIMLAADAGEPVSDDNAPVYDRVAFEPLAATVAGFLLLAMLLTVAFSPNTLQPVAAAASPTDQMLVEGAPQRGIAPVLPNRAANRIARMLDDEAAERIVQTPVTNTERVGLDLFRSHMLGLELAGVILLVSLVGAVVIARQKVNLMEADADTAEEAAA